jgi:hypothetical protein
LTEVDRPLHYLHMDQFERQSSTPVTTTGKQLAARSAKLLAAGVEKDGGTWYHYRDVEMLTADAVDIRRVEREACNKTLDEVKQLLADASTPDSPVAWSAIERSIEQLRLEDDT